MTAPSAGHAQGGFLDRMAKRAQESVERKAEEAIRGGTKREGDAGRANDPQTMPVADADTLTVTYETPLALLQDLRGMGETNALAARPRGFTPRAVLAGLAERYAPEPGNQRIAATFQILFLTAWAPQTG